MEGQALVFGLAFLIICCFGLALAVNSAQFAFTKTKMQDAADAAAYSAAVLQARDFNYTAYTNRAMIANQVAVAQALSLKSWLDGMRQAYRLNGRLDGLADKAEKGEAQWHAPRRADRGLIDRLAQMVDVAAPETVASLDAAIAAMSNSQQAYHDAIVTGIPDAVNMIASLSDSVDGGNVISGGLMAAPGESGFVQWIGLSARPDPTAGTTDRFADVVVDKATLDNFITYRGAAESDGGSSFRFYVGSKAKNCRSGFVSIYVTHAGGTLLSQNRKQWQALDAAQAKASYFCRTDGGIDQQEFTEMVGKAGAGNGAGAGYAGRQGYGGYQNYGGKAGGTGGALVHPLVKEAGNQQYGAGPGASLDPSPAAGLQPYRELTDRGRAVLDAADGFAPTLTVLVQQTVGSIRKLDVIGKGSGAIGAKASARAYFMRPDDTRSGMAGSVSRRMGWARDDGKWEYASLLNPYWQASLAP
ncbi:pilus assembly protein TadG-related protein [Burkholderia metallica]|uniref:pilus assembly protein TadG-related protein n=1 Tax=Burkholderia metallica TaxID=488729 RepID=UPI00157B9D0F|nr:pilus assembly protein TadG-related protein [Burkholderia metallica]